MKAIYERIATEIRTAEAIIVGASNGLSITEGFHLFADNLWFQTNFDDFRARYGWRRILDGMFHSFATEEEKWGFWSRLAYLASYQKPVSNVKTCLKWKERSPTIAVLAAARWMFGPIVRKCCGWRRLSAMGACRRNCCRAVRIAVDRRKWIWRRVRTISARAAGRKKRRLSSALCRMPRESGCSFSNSALAGAIS